MGRQRTIPFARGLSLPAEAITETFAFLGKRGSGKSYAASKLVEGMLDIGAQVVVLDPVGIWYGLRAGKSKFDIPILGGAHGDIPLEPTGGALIADVIIDKHTSAVLDLTSLSKTQRRTFVADFAERLFHRKKTARSPLHVVFEEAQTFAPQRTYRGSERMLGAVEDIVRLGRNYGIGASLISQRPQSVNKEVLNQVEVLVVLQLIGSHERKAIRSWVVEKGIDVDEMVDALPSLQQGTGFLWSPGWLQKLVKIRVLKKRSADTGATPKLSSKRSVIPTVALSKKELAKLQAAMADTVERAKENDPKALRRRIAELERNLQQARGTAERIEVPVVTQDQVSHLSCEVAYVREAIEGLTTIANSMEEALGRAAQKPEPVTRIQKVASIRRGTTPVRLPGESGPSPRRANGTNVHLRKGALRMLGSLAAPLRR